ncbi:MAG: cyclic nucleotide-binding domain-containing protein [Thermoplasmata archaeon]|nr:cyclic nucleotide-binding domain-containing protein [Thermoplasmata archaeon]
MSAAASAGVRRLIAEHPFFHGTDPAFLEIAAHGATEQRFDAGAMLVEDGGVADAFLLILHGKVALEVAAPDRPRRTIQTIGPGEVLGWSWLVPPHRWVLDARAVKPTRAVALDAAVLRRALAAHPESGYQFLLRLLPVIAQRLENTRLQLLDLHGV